MGRSLALRPPRGAHVLLEGGGEDAEVVAGVGDVEGGDLGDGFPDAGAEEEEEAALEGALDHPAAARGVASTR